MNDTIKRMRVFKLTDSQNDLLMQSLTCIRRERLPRLTGKNRKRFINMFNEVVGSYYPNRIITGE
jgi:hypothetical protein